MRALLSVVAAFIATPAMAQDNSGHADHGEEGEQEAQADDERREAAQADPLGQIRLAPRAVPAPSEDAHDHAAMNHAMQDIPTGPPPPRAFEGPAHAADAIWGEEDMVRARGYNRATHGDQRFGVLLVERLEAALADGEDEYVWDVTGWYGTATDKLVVKSEGEGEFGGSLEEAEVQLLWGHAIGPWFDLQLGARLDVEPETTAHAVAGIAGLAPYMIHVDAAAFLSDRGDLTARIEAEHDMRLTQRLVLQPRVELELAAQDIPEREIGAGLYEYSVGARLRYEFVPEFAPYLGLEYGGATGRTADRLRAAGEDADAVKLLAGLRFWF